MTPHTMHYEYLVSLRNHPAWRLLTADSAPLILGFFHLAFIKTNRRAISASELIAKLDGCGSFAANINCSN